MTWARASPGTITAVHRRSVAATAWLVADAMLGVAAGSARAGIGATAATAALARTLRPLTDLVARPSLLAGHYWLGHLLHRLADAGRDQRLSATQAALRYFRELAATLVMEIIDQLDLTALIRDRVDLVGLTTYLATAIDLPEIIRSSAGGPTSGAGQDLPVRSIEADEAVAAWVDRVFRR